MDNQTLLLIVTLLIGGGGIGALITALTNARKAKTDSENSIATTAIQIMKQTLENTVTPLNQRVDELEAGTRDLKTENKDLKEQIEEQQKAIDEIHAEFNKLQLAFVVNESYIRALGHKPPIELTSLADIKADDLRDIAMSMKNIERRRGGEDD